MCVPSLSARSEDVWIFKADWRGLCTMRLDSESYREAANVKINQRCEFGNSTHHWKGVRLDKIAVIAERHCLVTAELKLCEASRAIKGQEKFGHCACLWGTKVNDKLLKTIPMPREDPSQVVCVAHEDLVTVNAFLQVNFNRPPQLGTLGQIIPSFRDKAQLQPAKDIISTPLDTDDEVVMKACRRTSASKDVVKFSL